MSTGDKRPPRIMSMCRMNPIESDTKGDIFLLVRSVVYNVVGQVLGLISIIILKSLYTL